MSDHRPPRPTYWRWLLYPTALLTFGAAAIHFSVAPDHLSEYLPFGILFLITGTAQAVLAGAMLWAPDRRILAAAGLVAMACIVAWLVSRTVGLPLGPDERVMFQPADPLTLVLEIATANGQLAGALTSFLEVVSVFLIAILLAAGGRRRRHRRWWLASTVPAGVVITVLTAAGVGSGLNPLPEAVNMGTAAAGPSTTAMDSLVEPRGAQPVRRVTLVAMPVRLNGQVKWTYNGTVPGPELRVDQGDRLRVTLINHLSVSTAIHWHGLRLPNAEDGVAGLTQNAVPPGGTYVYEFVVKDPGTYWYHSHQDTERQVPMGLYGALVVEPKVHPPYDRDYAVTLGDSNDPNASLRLEAQPGNLVRLRIVSAYAEDMTGTPELLVLAGADYKVVALDGHDINQPQTLGPEILPIGTGQRYDLVFRMPESGQVRLLDERPQTGSRQIRRLWATLGDGPTPQIQNPRQLTHFDLTTYGISSSDPILDRASFDVSQDLRITSQVGFRYGSYEFVHMFNGASFPETNQILVSTGDYVRLRFINQTTEYHPIHLHGHFMTVISKNGHRLTGSPVHLDSVLVGPHETWEAGFVADNPGLWMIHCHVLIHAAYGLSTMLSYRDISTPYSIGSRSGNFPE